MAAREVLSRDVARWSGAHRTDRRAGTPAPLPRRTLLRSALLAGGAAAALGACSVEDDMTQADGPGAQTTRTDEPATQFGITLDAPPYVSQSQFEADLDMLRDLGLTWVRIAVVAEKVVKHWGFADGDVVLHTSVLEKIAAAAEAAHDRGFKVCMIVADIYANSDADEDEFLRNMRQYWKGVVTPLAEHVDVWQVLNEPDGAHFRTGEDVEGAARPAYLRTLARTLGAAHEVLQGVDDGITMTTNLYGYPLSNAMEKRWVQSLDTLAPHLDLITVDAYPELSEAQTLALPERVSRLRKRYGKQVAIGEMGLQTCTECATVEEQASAYRLYLQHLQDTSISTLFFYQLRDSGEDTGEGTFGIEKADGTAKPARAVIQEMLAG